MYTTSEGKLNTIIIYLYALLVASINTAYLASFSPASYKLGGCYKPCIWLT